MLTPDAENTPGLWTKKVRVSEYFNYPPVASPVPPKVMFTVFRTVYSVLYS